MKRALFILGMHRSGTSALTRVVNLLGAELGNALMAAAEDNPRGFWEHEAAVQINETLLTGLGHSWEDGIPLPKNWRQSEAGKVAYAEIRKLVDAEFAKAALWALKDPRLCLLFPLWEAVLEEKHITPYCIIAWRNPAEVVASLQKRDGLEQEEALLCWLAYTLESLHYAQRHPHVIVAYDDLLRDWQSAMKRAGEGLGITWPVSPESAAGEVDAFLSSDLRHHQKPLPEGNSPVLQMVRECLLMLQKGGIEAEAVSQLCTQWSEYTASFAPAIRRVRMKNHALSRELQQARQQAASQEHRAEDLQKQFEKLFKQYERQQIEYESVVPKLTQERDILQAELSRLLASTSWKVTRPLRQARAMLEGKKQNHD